MAPRDYELVLHIEVSLEAYESGVTLPPGLESGVIAIGAGSNDGRTWWTVHQDHPDDEDEAPPTLIDLDDAGDPLARLLAFLGFPDAPPPTV